MAAASFSQPGSVDSDSPDIVVSKLTEAIQSGNIDDAKIFASFLSKHRVRLKIDVSKDQNCQGDNEEEIEVNVKVEDRVSSGAELVLKVRPSDCIRDLKRMMWVRYRIPIRVQRWIIGKKIADDDTTLKKCGVTGSGFTIFLYVITAHSAQVQPYAENQFENDVLGAGLFSPAMSNTMSFDELGAGPFLDLAYPSRPQRGQHSPHLSPPPVPPRQPIEGDIDPEETHVVQPNQKLRTAMTIDVDNTPKEVGWECPRCTFINLPTRPGCSMCAGNRPEGYVVPKDYQLTEEEQTMVLTQEELERLTRQEEEATMRNNFQQWLQLDDLNLITNMEEFTCPVCMDNFEPGEGILLRECLHQFCRECLKMAVTLCEEASLKCPYQDEEGSCDSHLTQREIRTLVPEEVFFKYLQRGLDQAESQTVNSFHCKTTDCKGWCEYEDEVNFFTCPICVKENCLTCKVIHQGMDCKQYQAELAAKAVNNDAARKTQQWIQDMVKNGTAMHCPQCKIVMQKKDGCDWIKCSVCKTEICWVTKGPRWGPKGSGDKSGGCHCGENGTKCHPNCANCH